MSIIAVTGDGDTRDGQNCDGQTPAIAGKIQNSCEHLAMLAIAHSQCHQHSTSLALGHKRCGVVRGAEASTAADLSELVLACRAGFRTPAHWPTYVLRVS